MPRSIVYYKPKKESAENQLLMDLIDKLHLQDPAAGSRRLSKLLRRCTGWCIGRKRVKRLMRKMGIEAINPQKRTTIPGGLSGISPYRLKGLKIERSNQVWCADISYIRCIVATCICLPVMDWYSRKIIDCELSTTLDTTFCLKCLNRAIQVFGTPEIMNTDQGCQFTSEAWRNALTDADVTISMYGKGRWIDNVMIERFWRSIKYEDIYLKSYETPRALGKGIRSYILRYNTQRPHSSLSDMTLEEMYYSARKAA